jgi:hypothetical protein
MMNRNQNIGYLWTVLREEQELQEEIFWGDGNGLFLV